MSLSCSETDRISVGQLDSSASVACGPFSYGGQCGLLEVTGVIVDGKRENGEAKGWQTADNVIQMVRDYKCNKSR